MTILNALPHQDAYPLAELAPLMNLLKQKSLPSQLKAITADGPLTVVSAGAGTGKTWTLAWRFVWTVLTRAETSSMLTLTFTEKAAAEMRSRIARLMTEIRSELASPSGPCAKNSCLIRRLDEALLHLDEAYISTIHSFSMRVIRESGLVLPVDPGAHLVSTPEEEGFWSELTGALDRLDESWFSQRLSGESRKRASELINDLRTALLVNALEPKGLTDFARTLENLLAARGQTPEDLWQDAGSQAALNSALEAVSQATEPLLEKLFAPWPDFLSSADLDSFKNSTLIDKLKGLKSRWSSVPEDQKDLFVLDAAQCVANARGKPAEYLAGFLEMPVSQWRQSAEALRSRLELMRKGWRAEERQFREQALRLAWLCWACWQAFKDSRGVITFSDMIRLASDALRVNPRYAARFQEILVDEFQDTDPLQDSLIQSILKASRGNLFLVGDLKQSIYRFRHAEPALLSHYVQRAQNEPGGTYVPLDVSFRSSEAVLDTINRRFSHIWKSGLGRSLPQRYEALRSPRTLSSPPEWIDQRQQTDLPACERIFESFGKDSNGKKELTSAARERLIDRIARRLIELHQSGACLWDASRLRHLRWGDIAVLVPSRNLYEPLRKVFQRRHIPVTLEANVSYYARTEVRDSVNLIQLLANPGDRLALARFLCSPFSGLSQERAQVLLNLLSDATPLKDLKSAEPKLASRLEHWIRLAALRGSSAALSQILADETLLNTIPPLRRIPALANLRQALTQLEDYENHIGKPPQGAAAFLAEALASQIRQEEPQTCAEEDTVRVMTIHASKGLEFPLVVLLGLEKKESSQSPSPAIASRYLSFAAAKFPEDWPGSAQDPCRLKLAHQILDHAEASEEQARLYYVAQTRARDGLILGALIPDKDGGELSPSRDGSFSFLDFETQAVPFSRQDSPPDAEEPSYLQPQTASPQSPLYSAAKGADLSPPTQRVQPFRRISATSWALWNFCPLAWRRTNRQGLELTWTLPGKTEKEPIAGNAGGSDLGTLAHWIMQRWNFTPENMEYLLTLPDAFLPPPLRPLWRDGPARTVLRRMAEVFQHPEGQTLIRRMKEASERKDLRREYPFRLRINMEGEPLLLVGTIDVLWIERDCQGNPLRLCLRDYKTTLLPEEPAARSQIEAMYTDQLRFYGLVLRQSGQIWGALPQDLALWDLREGIQRLPTIPTAEEEKELLQKLGRMAAQAGTGPWPSQPSRCPHCPYRASCPGQDRKPI